MMSDYQGNLTIARIRALCSQPTWSEADAALLRSLALFVCAELEKASNAANFAVVSKERLAELERAYADQQPEAGFGWSPDH